MTLHLEEKERYCRKCKLTLPINRFFSSGQKRFCCRKHFYLMQHALKRPQKDEPDIRALHYARRLAKKVFSGYDMTVTRHEAQTALQRNLCIVPMDPSKPLGIQNMHMCSPARRRLLRQIVTRPNFDNKLYFLALQG